MKETYPERDSYPITWLVEPSYQPDFIWTADEEAATHANVGRESIDGHCLGGHGDDLAIVCLETGECWSYQQLKDASDRLAGALVELGLKIGDRVALRCLSRPRAVVAAVGAWKAGAAVVPIPAQARSAEIAFYLEDTAARWAVTDAELLGELESAPPAAALQGLVVIGESGPGHLLDELIAQGDPRAALEVRTLADDLATVWHTGGTTGQPKATYHTHRRWLAAGRRLAHSWYLGRGQRWVHGIPIGNVAGLLGRFVQVLQQGATLIEPASLTGSAVLDAIAKERVTHLLGIPVTLDQLADAAGRQPQVLASLERVYAPFLVTGAGDIYERWESLGHHLSNPLGSSVMCNWFVGPHAHEEMPAFALGRPAEGYELRIVDIGGASADALSPGEVGRIAARGATGLTYWNRPELQQQEVVDGWTVTDDLGRQDEDGVVWFMGRMNNLVVTAGYKVAPVEVEQVLLKHPAVREVVVVGLPDPVREQVVAAFVVARGGQGSPVLAAELQEWCKARLAPYKYPRRVLFRSSLPRDPVGKVQIRELVAEASQA